MRAYWLKGFSTFRLKSQWTTIDIGKGHKLARINNLPIYLGFPSVAEAGRLYIAKADLEHVIRPVLTPQVFEAPPKLGRIVIDAGHGGQDSGAINKRYGLQEKVLAMDVAKRLRALLERAGYDVAFTREEDQYVSLERRALFANRSSADAFVSIHFNAAANRSAAGYETFALTPQHQASSKFQRPSARDARRYKGNASDPWNTLLGYHVQRELTRRMGGPDCGLKRARFVVLKHLECPGVLVELGFVSNDPSAQKMRSAAHRQSLAQSLYEGIVAYHNRLKRIR